MIKSALATAIVAGSIVPATTVFAAAHAKADKSVTVYGRLRMSATCVDAGNGADTDCGLRNHSSRFGIKASSQISDGLTAFGKYEFGTDPDEATFFKAEGAGGTNRLGYVGLKGGFGEISIGTRWSPLYTHTISPVDAPNAFGGTSGAFGYNTDFRNSDTINYKNKFGAASVDIQLQMDDGDTDSDAIDEATIAASFKAGPATIAVAYQDNKDNFSIAAIHARGKFGAFGVGATYSAKDNESAATADVNALTLAANYGMGGGKSLNLTYGMNDIDGTDATPTTIGIEYVHNMGAGFKWFAGYNTDDADINGVDAVNKYGAGMRYDF